MLNPILPQSAGGDNPELEGRVDALEGNVSGLNDRTSAVEQKTSEVENSVEVMEFSVASHEDRIVQNENFRNAVQTSFSGFSTVYIYGSAGNWLTWDTPLSRFDTLLGPATFKVNGEDVTVEVEEDDTVNTIVNKIYTVANGFGYNPYPLLFAGNLRFEVTEGISIAFPPFSNGRSLWSVLGLMSQSATSMAIERDVALNSDSMFISPYAGETIEARFARLGQEIDILDYAAGRLGYIEPYQSPQMGQEVYIFGSTSNYFSGADDFSDWLTPSDVMEVTVNGDTTTIIAGDDRTFWGLFNTVTNALPSGLMMEYFGGQCRIRVDGNTEVAISNTKFSQLFGFANSTAKTVEFEQQPYGFRSNEILHEFNRIYPLSLDQVLNRMNGEIHVLQNGISTLLYQLQELKDEMKNGGA